MAERAEQGLRDAAAQAPVRAALALGVAEVLLYTAYHAVFSLLPFAVTHGAPFGAFRWFPELIMGPLIGLCLVAPLYSRARALDDFAAMRPALRAPGAELEALRRRIADGSRQLIFAATAVGVVSGVAMTFYPGVWAEGVPPGVDHPDLSWGLLRNPLLMAAAMRAVAGEYDLTRVFSRIGREAIEIDLLDRTRFRPLVRRGLRSVLMLAIGAALSSPLALAPWKPDTWLAFMPLAASVAACALILPLRGVQERIRAAKDAELDRVRERIRKQRGALQGDAAAAGGPLAELLAWEERIERVREWPFDAPALLRFGLYLAIPLGGWLGGALVERVLDVFLD
jgi:hypothetical protein